MAANHIGSVGESNPRLAWTAIGEAVLGHNAADPEESGADRLPEGGEVITAFQSEDGATGRVNAGQAGGHHPVVRGHQVEVSQVVIGMSVEPRAYQDPVRRKLGNNRQHEVIPRLAVDIPGSSARQRHVDHSPFGLTGINVLRIAGIGVKVILVDRHVQDSVVVPEHVLGAVAVVDIPVEYRHTLAPRAQQSGGDGHIVEHAEAHGSVGQGVVAGWPADCEPNGIRVVSEFLNQCSDSPGCGQRRFPRGGACVGVQVEGATALLAELSDRLHVRRIVDQRQFAFVDSRRSDITNSETAVLDAVPNRFEALRSLGMTRTGVVLRSCRVTRNYDVHVLTLAQVRPPIRVEGTWPGPVTISAGWFRARARPWNEEITSPLLRLDRGGVDFLRAVIDHFADIGESAVYSPALYAGATRVWRRSGFDDYVSLDVMERPLVGQRANQETGDVRKVLEPDWGVVLDIDRHAFEGFWGMSELGLIEAYHASRNSVLLVTPARGQVDAYAIVGAEWASVFLHRIAVRPDHSGQGLGAALLSAALRWGERVGGRSMILNVRPENSRARRLYEKAGFADTGTPLLVLRRHHMC